MGCQTKQQGREGVQVSHLPQYGGDLDEFSDKPPPPGQVIAQTYLCGNLELDLVKELQKVVQVGRG